MYRRRILFPSAVVLLAAVLLPMSASAAVPTSERDALIAIFNSTGGTGWSDRTNWLGAPGTECTWFGIRCNDASSAVIGIYLQQNNLVGSIPSAVGSFPALEELDLFTNKLTGPIPPSIGSLRALRTLGLYDNTLQGPLPRELGQLTNVTFFALGQNQISGIIPPELGNLTRAEFFSFNGNLLTGPIPRELGGLAEARTLSLSYNQLEGPIPPELGRLSKLVELQLTDNRLTGTIPAELTTIATLQQFHVQINRLSGPLPAQIGQLTSLYDLQVSNNNFTGSIPEQIGNLRNLRIFSASNNQLTGPLPRSIAQLINLGFFEAVNNHLSGPLPAELSLLVNLEYLDLAVNEFTGNLPASFGELTKLTTLSASYNQLTGSIPFEWRGMVKLQSLSLAENKLSGELRPELVDLQELREIVLYSNQLSGRLLGGLMNLPKLQLILLGDNRFHGPMPDTISNLTELQTLHLAGNRLTGSIVPLGRLTRLEYLALNDNQFTGPIQPEIGLLTKLVDLRLSANRLSGTLPPQIGQLVNLEVLLLGDNRLQGQIPSELGLLQKLDVLSLPGNSFQGPIPAALGSLRKLRQLDLAQNALRPAIPRELMNLTGLTNGESDFSLNALQTGDAALRDFLNLKQNGGDWESSQTIAPTAVTVSDLTDRSAVVGWRIISNQHNSGGYRVTASTTPGGPAVAVATTDSKYSDTVLVRGLQPSTTYFFVVRTVSSPEGFQRNALVSDATAPVSATTTAAVLQPPMIELVSGTEGLVQEGAIPQNEDSFVLINVGDVGTTITLANDGTFFTQSPTTFALAPGQSQTVRITTVPQPPGAYEGESLPSGLGIPPGFTIAVRLLSTPAISGTVIASASTSRVDTSGDRNTTSVGSVSFTNSGTATLSGIVVSDAPWIEAPTALITIPAGQTTTVSFTIDRRDRPDADDEDGGALAADFKLVYLDGTSSAASLSDYRPNQTAPSGVSTTLVTVVDTTRPRVAAAAIPPLLPDEVARFIAGVAQIRRGSATYISDLSVTNSFGSEPLRDLRIYYSSPSNQPSAAATFNSVAPSSSLSLSSVVRTTFGADSQVGTLQLRTVDWDRILVNASLLNVGRADRTLTTLLPVFRSDRSARAGQKLFLTGLHRDNSQRTDFYLQETSGNPATLGIEFFDASGNRVGATRPDDPLAAFGLLELLDVVPANAVSAIVSNRNTSTGRLVAYARMTDSISGDAWSIVDWNLFSDFTPTEEVRIPLVRSSGEGSPLRRRAVRRNDTSGLAFAPTADGGSARTELSILNRDTTASAGILRFRANDGSQQERTIDVGPRQTLLIGDIVGEFFGKPGGSGYLEFEPIRGQFSISARLQELGIQPGSFGSTLPTIPSSAGIRLGQSQTFAGLDDSTLVTVNAKRPGTFRTDFGIMEMFGEPVTVRVTLLYFDGRSLASSRQTRSRDFQLAARQLLNVQNAANAIIGPSRETTLGSLHNIQLEFQVVGGEGAAAIFVTTTDNGSQDSSVRSE